MKAPVLTLPPQEASWIRSAYADASTILEYGSGGSTCLGATMLGKTIFSVESDRAWTTSMEEYFSEYPPVGTVHMHHVDVGPTGKWGTPIDESGWRQFHQYPLSVWDRPDFVHPDIVLIDGRFRAACLLAVLFRITKPVTAYFDDYTERPRYHVVERLAPVVETRGRMARFELEPTVVPGKSLSWILDIFHEKS